MCGTILFILYFHGDDGAGERSLHDVSIVVTWQEFGWEGGVHGVSEEGKLELHLLLEFHTDSIGFFKEDGITPEIILK